MTDEDGMTATVNFSPNFELARTHQTENIRRQLSKLGDTIFEPHIINIYMKKNYFIPSSQLNAWRRELSSQLTEERIKFYPLEKQAHTPVCITTEPSFELTHDRSVPVMVSKYCIRRQLAICPKENKSLSRPVHNALSLCLANGTTFRLDFDCKNCLMKLYLP